MIRELSFWENVLFRMGAILMLIGVTVHIFNAEISLFIYWKIRIPAQHMKIQWRS